MNTSLLFKVISAILLILGIIEIERAYKKDNGKIAIIGIELLVLSIYTLSILHMVSILKCGLKNYLIVSFVIIAIYYIIKIIINSIKKNQDKLNTVSDISEIVKKDEPVKKEAKKRNVEKTQEEEKKQATPKNDKTKKQVTEASKQTKKSTTPKKKTKKEVEKND